MIVLLFSLVLVSAASVPKCIPGDVLLQLPPYDFSQPSARQHVGLLRDMVRQAGPFGRLFRKHRRAQVAERLREHAAKSQAELRKDLRAAGIPFTTFWINNSILVRSPPCHLQLVLLAKYEAGGVEMVPADRIVAHIPAPMRSRTPLLDRLVTLAVREGQTPWNLAMINAEQAWARSKGDQITVATIDTGVAFQHQSIAKAYRGITHGHALAWFDPQGTSSVPQDTVGHGTHTMGTIVGDVIGVAPGATWMTARGCTEKGCSQRDLLASAQWTMCPIDEAGTERCDLGADLVSNSWGSSGGNDGGVLDWFTPVIDAWTAAGIVTIFAIGNEGPKCGTAGAPGTFASVIGVGSVGQSHCLSRFSSHGPGPSKSPYSPSKPDLVAPGEGILSASHSGAGHVAMSGTSMAAPHVAGVVALMLALNPSLDTAKIARILKETCQTSPLIRPSDGLPVCKAINWNDYPNSLHYGAGLIDAAAALAKVAREKQ